MPSATDYFNTLDQQGKVNPTEYFSQFDTPDTTSAATIPEHTGSTWDEVKAYGADAVRSIAHIAENLAPPPETDPGDVALAKPMIDVTNLPQHALPDAQRTVGQKITTGLVSMVPIILTGRVGGVAATISAFVDGRRKAADAGLSEPSSFFHGLIDAGVTATMMKASTSSPTLLGTLGRSAVAGPGLAIGGPLLQKGLAETEASLATDAGVDETPYEKYAKSIGMKEIFDPANIGVAAALTFGTGIPHYMRANREADLALATYKAAQGADMAISHPAEFSVLEKEAEKAVKGRPQESMLAKLQSGEDIPLTDLPSERTVTPPTKGKDVAIDDFLSKMSEVVDDAPRTEPIGDVAKKIKGKKGKAVEQSTEATPEGNAVPVETVPAETELPYTKTLYRGIADRDPLHAGGMGKGTYYTTDLAIAKSYAEDFSVTPGKVITEDITLTKPFHADTIDDVFNVLPESQRDPLAVNPGESITQLGERQQQEITKILTERGYDGIVLHNSLNPTTGNLTSAHEVVVFPKSETKLNVQKPQVSDGKKYVSIGTETQTVSASPIDTTYQVEHSIDGKQRILISPDDYVPEQMISKIRENIASLKEEYPKATFTILDNRGEVPKEVMNFKSIGNRALSQIKKEFGATEDINPRAQRANISVEEKVARLVLKDPATRKALAKSNPEMVAKLVKDAGQKGTLESTVGKKPPAIQQDVWYKGFKDGDTVTSRDRAKVERDLPGAEIIKGKMDGVNFLPEEQRVVSESAQSAMKELTALLTNERGSFSLKDKAADPTDIERQRKVKTELRVMFNYKKAYAESLGKDVKSYMLEQGMAEQDYNRLAKLVNADKGFTQPQMGFYLSKALKFETPEYREFLLKTTGIEKMNDMTPEQQQRVINNLQQLYFLEHGEEYRVKGRAEKKLLQADIENAIYEQDMHWKNAYGMIPFLHKVISSGEAFLSKWEAGSNLVRIVKQRDLNATLRSAAVINDFRKLSKGMTDAEMKSAVHVHLGEATSTNAKVNELAKFIHEAMTPIGQEMETLGVEITNPLTNKKEAFTFKADEPYWPREYDWEDIQNPGRMRDNAVRHLMKKYGVTEAVALQKLNSIIQNGKSGPNSFGHIEIARFADLPNFHDNPAEVLPNYIYNAVRRLEYIAEFGQDDIGLAKHLAKLEVQGGREASDYAKAVVDRVFGNGEYGNRRDRAIINAALSAEVISKLGITSTISNAAQPVNTYMHTNLKSMYRGMKRLIDPMTRAEALDFAHNSGATFHTMVDAYSEYRRDPTSLVKWLRNTVPKGEVVFKDPTMAGNFLRYTGFTQVEIFNRLYTAIVGREYARQQFELLRNTTAATRSGRLAEIRLRKLGLDPTELRTRELTDRDLYQGSNALVEKTQFRNSALSLPKWTGDSVWARLITQFHSFAFHQSKMLKDLWLTEPERILPSIIAMASAGLITGSAKDLFRGKKRDSSKPIENTLYFLGSAAGLGMWMDSIQSAVYSKYGALGYVGGPVLGDLSEYAFATGAALSGKPEVLGRKMLRDVPIVGPTINNLTKPYKRGR